MRFLPPKTHSKNPSPLGEGFLCFLTCNSPSHPSGPWAGRCDDTGFDKDISEKKGINAVQPGEIFEKGYQILVG